MVMVMVIVKKLTSTLGPKFLRKSKSTIKHTFRQPFSISNPVLSSIFYAAFDGDTPVAVGIRFWCFSENLHADLDLQVGGTAVSRTTDNKQTTENKQTKQNKNNKNNRQQNKTKQDTTTNKYIKTTNDINIIIK